MKSARNKIAKAAGLLLVLQALSHLTGLMNQMLVAASFGTSAIMDSYIVATTIVGLILLWIGLPAQQTVIPMFRYALAQRGERAAWTNASVLINTFLLVIIAIVLVGEVLAPFMVDVLAPGFPEETRASAAALTRITIANVLFIGMAGVLSQIFFSYERFFRPGIARSVDHLVVLLVLLTVGATYGIYGLALAAVLGAACRFVFLLSILWEKRQFYSRSVDLRDAQVAEMGKLSLPLLISTGGNEVARVTDRIFGSLLPAGSLSALAFAHRPTSVLFEFLIQPLQHATFPHFTKLSAEKDFRTLSHQLFQYLRIIFFLTLPAAFGLMLMSESVVRALYHRGAFDETAVHLTTQALFFYAIGIPAQAMARVFRSTFFGLKDTWTPTKIAFISIGVKIFLSWTLIGSLAHAGIALGESISQVTNAVFLFWFLPKKVKREEGWKTVTSFAQTLVCCVIMGGVVYLAKDRVYELLGSSLDLVCFFSLVLLGVAVYGGIALLFQGEASQSVLKALTHLGGKYLLRSS